MGYPLAYPRFPAPGDKLSFGAHTQTQFWRSCFLAFSFGVHVLVFSFGVHASGKLSFGVHVFWRSVLAFMFWCSALAFMLRANSVLAFMFWCSALAFMLRANSVLAFMAAYRCEECIRNKAASKADSGPAIACIYMFLEPSENFQQL